MASPAIRRLIIRSLAAGENAKAMTLRLKAAADQAGDPSSQAWVEKLDRFLGEINRSLSECADAVNPYKAANV